MSNLMIKYVAQREIYSFGKKHDWKNLHFKGPCEWWLPIFLVQKPSLFFLQQQKIGLQIENRVYKYITKYWGEKIGGSHKCVFLVPVHLKSFTISVLQFQHKNIVHLLDTYVSHSGDSFLNSSGVQFFVKNFNTSFEKKNCDFIIWNRLFSER